MTTLIQENTQKETAPSNYRSIMYLPMMWKILAAQIKEDIYYSLVNNWLFPEEQKGCHKETRGTGYLLYIDQNIRTESKTRRKNMASNGNSNTNNMKIHPGYRGKIWQRKYVMLKMRSGKRKMTERIELPRTWECLK